MFLCVLFVLDLAAVSLVVSIRASCGGVMEWEEQ